MGKGGIFYRYVSLGSESPSSGGLKWQVRNLKSAANVLNKYDLLYLLDEARAAGSMNDILGKCARMVKAVQLREQLQSKKIHCVYFKQVEKSEDP